ncbi:MAG: isoprenylcysteine carboxylmethyltransferase family protein [Rubripirellula sp.]
MFHALLIAGQFGLAAAIVLSARWWPVPWTALLISMPSIVFAVWAWGAIGLRKVRVQPSTTDQTKLITSGPYSIVRHPMYTGLLWFTAALLASGFAWWRLGVWIALLGVLLLKTREEEAAMSKRFADYAGYRSRVGRLLPTWKFSKH